MSDESHGICVIVLNYFGATHTRHCAEALIGQTLDTLCLVDNSNDAEQARAIRALAADIQANGAGFTVRVLINDSNLGFGRAINAAITTDRQQGGHRYYLLLNNDALVPPEGIASLLQTLRRPPAAALVSPRIRTDQRCNGWLHYNRWLSHIDVTPSPRTFSYLIGACLLIDAETIDDGGPFDEVFFCYGEDVLLNWRTQQRGGIRRCADDVIVDHIGSASSGHCSPLYEYHIAHSHILLAARLADGPGQRRWYLLGRAIYLPARALLRTLRFRDSTPLRMLWRAWRGQAPVLSTADPGMQPSTIAKPGRKIS